MKLTINASVLAEWLNSVSKIISNNATLPILKNILFEAKDNKLKLWTSDISTHCWLELSASVEEDGTTTVPAKLITSYVNFIGDEEILLSLDDETQTLFIKSDSNDTEIKCVAPNDFPSVAQIEPEQEFEISIEHFLELINETTFACSKDMTRPIFAGIYLYSKAEKLIGVATDSFRLSEKTANFDNKNTDIKAIIPAKPLNILSSIIGGLKTEKEKVLVQIEKSQIAFFVDNISFVSKTIEGVFPDYQKIIPEEHKTTITVDKESFINKIKQINIFSSIYSSAIILNIIDGKLEISAENDERGKGKSILNIEQTGTDNKIALNSQFLLEWLSKIKSNSIYIELSEENKPAIIKDDENNFLYLVLPLRV